MDSIIKKLACQHWLENYCILLLRIVCIEHNFAYNVISDGTGIEISCHVRYNILVTLLTIEGVTQWPEIITMLHLLELCVIYWPDTCGWHQPSDQSVSDIFYYKLFIGALAFKVYLNNDHFVFNLLIAIFTACCECWREIFEKVDSNDDSTNKSGPV